MTLSLINDYMYLYSFFRTHVHSHIEKMGNLSKSKLKFYICDNKLRSCAQFAPRGKCAPGC